VPPGHNLKSESSYLKVFKTKYLQSYNRKTILKLLLRIFLSRQNSRQSALLLIFQS